MSQPASIPWLEATTIEAAMELQDERDASRTITDLFVTEQFIGERLSIPHIIHSPQRVRHTTEGGRAMPVTREEIVLHEYKPSWIKLVDDITSDDKTKFYDALAPAVAGMERLVTMRMATADRITQSIASRFRKNLQIEKRALCAGALHGSYVYRLGDEGTDKTVDLQLENLDSVVGTDWDDASATIVTDISDAIIGFKDLNESGEPPTHVFYNPKNLRGWLLANTQFQTMIGNSARLSEWFVGLGNRGDWMDMEGRILDPLWGLTWVAVEGTQLDISGNSEDVFPDNVLTFARLGPDGAQPTWFMKFDAEQTPGPEPKIEIKAPSEGDEVKNHKVVLFFNGLPGFKRPDLVVTMEIQTD